MRLSPKPGWKTFFKDLKSEISNDNVSNGAAALAYYLLLALFPALLALLTLVPYMPVQDLEMTIINFVEQGLPGQASTLVTKVLDEIRAGASGGLFSVGLLGTIWAASRGFYAIMQQMNITYGVKEKRPFLKAKGTSVLMMLIFLFLIIGGFALVVFGGQLESWVAGWLGESQLLLTLFNIIRWVIIVMMSLLAFAVLFYFGPNVDQKFRWITPGSIIGTILLGLATVAFKFYVSNFGNYSASYGSIGAVIILMFWLYIAGFVLLLGSEINALLQSYHGEQQEKAEKLEKEQLADQRPRFSPHPSPGRA